jgi:hypothetical protein
MRIGMRWHLPAIARVFARRAIVAAAHDPFSVFCPTDDLSNVMAPDDDRADLGMPGIGPVVSPLARPVVGRPGIASHLLAHVPTAPGGRPSRPSVMHATGRRVMVAVMMVPGVGTQAVVARMIVRMARTRADMMPMMMVRSVMLRAMMPAMRCMMMVMMVVPGQAMRTSLSACCTYTRKDDSDTSQNNTHNQLLQLHHVMSESDRTCRDDFWRERESASRPGMSWALK